MADVFSAVANIRFMEPRVSGPRVGVYSLNIGDAESALVRYLWQDYGMATRPAYHCAPLMHEALGTAVQGRSAFLFSIYDKLTSWPRLML